MEVLISNHSGIAVDIDFLSKLAEEILNLEEVDAEAELSIVLIDEGEIKKLNAEYRGINSATDVISFSQPQDHFEGPHLLGDVVISPQVAQTQALEYHHSFEKEMAILLIHGILHLLGYDHENSDEKGIMKAKEEKILNDFLARGKIK